MKNPKDESLIKDWEKNLMRQLTIRAVAEFLIVAAVLAIGSWLVHCHVKQLLNDAMEKAVSRHIGTITHALDHQFAQELNEIKVGASLIERNLVDVRGLFELVTTGAEGKFVGITAPDGRTFTRQSGETQVLVAG